MTLQQAIRECDRMAAQPGRVALVRREGAPGFVAFAVPRNLLERDRLYVWSGTPFTGRSGEAFLTLDDHCADDWSAYEVDVKDVTCKRNWAAWISVKMDGFALTGNEWRMILPVKQRALRRLMKGRYKG